MRIWLPRCAVLVLALLASATSLGSPLDFDLQGYDKPTVLEGVGQLRACTVAYLLVDVAANDTFIARMQFTPSPSTVPLQSRLPCPALVPKLVGETALNLCRDHAARPADCVFADMNRGFHDAPELANTTEDASRCTSDRASRIAIACANAGDASVCNVGCAEDSPTAIAEARSRCEATHQTSCPITAVLPVSAP
jgi:hypothetical protein